MTLFRDHSRRRPLGVGYTEAANSNTPEDVDTGAVSVPPVVTPEILTPQSADEEPIMEMRASSKPASLVSMRLNKVIGINGQVLDFCNEAYDTIMGYDILQLFEARRQEERFRPTDIRAFHERLKQDRELTGTIRSWRSSMVFAIYPVYCKYVRIYGVPTRLTFFDPIEIVV